MIFFINVPLALLCAPIAWRMLKRYEDTLKRVPIDKVGLVLLIVAVGALQLMLDLGKEHDWFESAEIWALAIVAVVGLAAFLIWESTERHPIVDLRVFRHRGFSICVLTISIGFGGYLRRQRAHAAVAAELYGLHVHVGGSCDGVDRPARDLRRTDRRHAHGEGRSAPAGVLRDAVDRRSFDLARGCDDRHDASGRSRSRSC